MPYVLLGGFGVVEGFFTGNFLALLVCGYFPPGGCTCVGIHSCPFLHLESVDVASRFHDGQSAFDRLVGAQFFDAVLVGTSNEGEIPLYFVRAHGGHAYGELDTFILQLAYVARDAYLAGRPGKRYIEYHVFGGVVVVVELNVQSVCPKGDVRTNVEFCGLFPFQVGVARLHAVAAWLSVIVHSEFI